MKYCVRCGRPLNVNDRFCNGCGMRQPYVPQELLEGGFLPSGAECGNNTGTLKRQDSPSPTVPAFAFVPATVAAYPHKSRRALPFLVWSLILMLFFNIVGTPLAAIAAFLSLSVNAGTQGAGRKVSAAAALCTVATIADISTLLTLFFSALLNARGGMVF